MQKLMFVGGVLSSTIALAAANVQPLDVQTGLWQVTMTSKVNASPAPNTTTYTSCVTKEDLSRYPFTDPDANCTWTVVSSTGSKMEANGTCMPEGMGKVGFKMLLEAVDSKTIKGTGQLSATSPMGPMDGTYIGAAKWVGPQCKSDRP